MNTNAKTVEIITKIIVTFIAMKDGMVEIVATRM